LNISKDLSLVIWLLQTYRFSR